jgi:hypothetical protein
MVSIRKEILCYRHSGRSQAKLFFFFIFFWIPPCLQHGLTVGIPLPRDESLGFGSGLPLGETFLAYFDFDLFLDLTENTIGIAGEKNFSRILLERYCS